MNYPSIKIRLNGYMSCTLLGKAEIRASCYKGTKQFYIVYATTPTEKRHKFLDMLHTRIKTVDKAVGDQGYLVYFGTGIAGWFELIPFTDERFSKYEAELLEIIGGVS